MWKRTNYVNLMDMVIVRSGPVAGGGWYEEFAPWKGAAPEVRIECTPDRPNRIYRWHN